MEVSNRIKAIVEEIEYGSITDIGTDHCYIPLFALEKGKVQRALACDINKGPLDIAAKNVAASGYAGQIQLRLSNGFQKVAPGETQAAVIAGMGGQLIIQILENSPEVADGFLQLVLQPQSHWPLVRRKIHNMGFSIKNERILCELGQYYCIINGIKGDEACYTEKEYLLGKVPLQKREAPYTDYIRQELRKTEIIIKKIRLEADNNLLSVKNKERLHYLDWLADMYREVLQLD